MALLSPGLVKVSTSLGSLAGRLPARAPLVLALAVSPASAACTAPPTAAKTLRIAVQADVTGFFPNPPVRNESYTFAINRSIYDSLLVFDASMRLRPHLATSWESPDDHTWILVLRDDARFSDGSPVTAADAAASLEATIRHGWANLDYLQPIRSVRALDDHRVEIRSRSTNLTFLTRLPWSFVLPAGSVDRDPVPVVGSGPYRLESWERNASFTFVRNPYYWGDPPAFERARFAVVPDGGERVAMVQRGEADMADAVPLEDLDALEADPRLRVRVGSNHRVLYLGLRLDTPPFDDPRVREAIDLAIDREELSRRALAGRAPPATQLVPPSIVGHNPAIPPPHADRRRARELLAEAGHPEGFAVQLDGPINRYVNDVAIAHEVARQLGEVGVEVDVVTREKRPFFDMVFSGGSAFHLLGWASETGDAGDAIEFLAHSPTEGRLGRLNTTALRDPEIDAELRRADAATSIAARSRHLQSILARVAELRAMLPLVIQTEAVLHTTEVEWDPPLTMAIDAAQVRPARVRGRR